MSQLTPDRCVALYLVHSYLYYKLDINIISDTEFDNICKILLKHWNNLTHPHKKYISKESLTAGSGYDINFNNLPSIIKMTAYTLHSGVGMDGKPIKREEWLI